MPHIIAGIYEIQEQIGAGGGGVVYIGRHLRLNKQVVLKADKRTLSVGTEKLRREVDMLKDLSHRYIPQVYDFVQEDGVVYTVMDYIEGESLDKRLARNEIPTQPELIKWSCQLLEALAYLHSRPPYGILHGDIKPANIMIRPNGDICLIDFNIALSLGEDGAVKVGFSRGYASPEHYSADYLYDNKSAAVGVANTSSSNAVADDDRTMVDDEDKTVVDDDKTVVESKPSNSVVTPSTVGSITRSRPGILLDSRSDIYSLGATLYHLISGKRPAQDAKEVVKLGKDVCSPAVSDIIRKAMAVEPKDRYQSAEDMLNAFLQLHKNDKRIIRHKRRMVVAGVLLSALFLAGGALTFIGLKQLEQKQSALALAEYSANALSEGDVALAIEQAMEAIPGGKSILDAPVTAQAQKALTDALGVYRLSDSFQAINKMELPSAPFDVVISPTEKYIAAVYAYEVAVFALPDCEQIVTLPIQQSALSDVIFVGEDKMVYAGKDGVALYDLGTGQAVWTKDAATTLSLSADEKILAAVNRDADEVIFYNVSDGSIVSQRNLNGMHMSVAANDIFADPQKDVFALNNDGSMLAMSFSNGGLYLLDTKDANNDLIVYEESEYTRFRGGFHNQYFAFSAEKSGEALFGIVDSETASYVGGYTSNDSILVSADAEGIYVSNGNLLVCVDTDTLEEKELAYTDSVAIKGFATNGKHVLVATDDNGFAFYDSGANLMSKEEATQNCDFVVLSQQYAVVANRNETAIRVLALQNHSDTQRFAYDARIPHEEARISYDEKTVMLFDYEKFYLYKTEDGSLITEVEIPDAANIYDQQYRKSETGSWLEVIWYDGTVRCYDAADGVLLSEEQKEAPSKELTEEFETDAYRIVSTLHSAPVVFDKSSGEEIATLEEDAYLTYVTQMDGYIVTEYINTAGERYGLLLNNDLETLAYLPGLCDVTRDSLIFDYSSGDLRESRIYSLDELIELGKQALN